MTINYVKSQSVIKPNPIEATADYVYLHKNVTSHDENGITFYYYDEAKLTTEEFNNYANQNLINDQLSIMEAFTDLYELLASKLEEV